ncbi:MAG: PPC domain-containing DNA-binding protein [Thermoplasmata archaeon]|jgi:uncharacterized protein
MQTVHDGSRWMLRVDDGQDLFEALRKLATAESLRAAVVISGIGMLKHATVGYWNGSEYVPEELREPHEMISLHGSIAENEGEPSIHLHVGLVGPDHRCVGGHLLQGTIGVLGEIYLETFAGRVFARPLNESIGLRMLDLDPGTSA